MGKVPTKVAERVTKNFNKIKKVVTNAISRDINEADTVVIVSDILSDIFGYDKYSEITREFAIRNTYCDLAIKIDDEVNFLIEVKAIGITLNEKHIKQAVDYGANQGIDWVVLTNCQEWRIFKLQFEKPIYAKLIFSFNFLELNPRKNDDLDKLFVLCREGLQKNAILEFSNYKQVVNKFYISAILNSDCMINNIKRELNKILAKNKVDESEIRNILENSVLKRDLIESDEAKAASLEYHKFLRKAIKKKASKSKSSPIQEPVMVEVHTE